MIQNLKLSGKQSVKNSVHELGIISAIIVMIESQWNELKTAWIDSKFFNSFQVWNKFIKQINTYLTNHQK